MKIEGSIALVTGSNRGIGRRFAEALLARGAAKVYATARTPEKIDIPGVETLQLDITDPASVEAAAAVATDVTLLINNAGISTPTNFLTGSLADIRREMDTHFYGTLDVVRAFAPILGANGGGAIVNVLSALSWFSYNGSNAYGAAKSAEWSLTNGIRLELESQGTLVTGLHLGAADTDIMAAHEYEGDLIDPAEVARLALDGVENDAFEVVADDWSAMVKASLAGEPGAFYRSIGMLGQESEAAATR
ncbi:SDR family oxidoreductase [Frondihabitans cladoniiphilus]|uniref:SDR family oxidoreductase n=1 Tax=Frondihabitans cladoniiphilus TaxID=715785 RepID=A0ABP8W8L3_9MICO